MFKRYIKSFFTEDKVEIKNSKFICLYLPGVPLWSCRNGWTAAAAAALTLAAAAAEDPTVAARCDKSNGLFPADIALFELLLWSKELFIEVTDSFTANDGKAEKEVWPGVPLKFVPTLALDDGDKWPCGSPVTPYKLAAKRKGLLDAAAATAAADDGSPPKKWWYGVNGGGL